MTYTAAAPPATGGLYSMIKITKKDTPSKEEEKDKPQEALHGLRHNLRKYSVVGVAAGEAARLAIAKLMNLGHHEPKSDTDKSRRGMPVGDANGEQGVAPVTIAASDQRSSMKASTTGLNVELADANGMVARRSVKVQNRTRTANGRVKTANGEGAGANPPAAAPGNTDHQRQLDSAQGSPSSRGSDGTLHETASDNGVNPRRRRRLHSIKQFFGRPFRGLRGCFGGRRHSATVVPVPPEDSDGPAATIPKVQTIDAIRSATPANDGDRSAGGIRKSISTPNFSKMNKSAPDAAAGLV